MTAKAFAPVPPAPVRLEPGRPLTREQTLRGVAGIDWKAWQPTVRATLIFVIRDGRKAKISLQ